MQTKNKNTTLRQSQDDVLKNVKLLDLLVDVRRWSVENKFLIVKIDEESEKPFYALTDEGAKLDWVERASNLYHSLIRMPNFALQENLLKRSVYQENGERRTFRVTGKAVRDYGGLLADGYHANNADYKGSAWDDDVAAGFRATNLLFNEA